MDSERFRNITRSREHTASVFIGLAASSTRKGNLGKAQRLRDFAQHIRQQNHDDYSSRINEFSEGEFSIKDLQLL